MPPSLPPGQRALDSFPRFGLPPFAARFPRDPNTIRIQIRGEVVSEIVVDSTKLATLPRVEQVSDFHCVTTWTRQALVWSGFRFADFYRRFVEPVAHEHAAFVVLRGQDGYRASLPLADLLGQDVLLADRLNGEPLSIAHGAPLRLIAPAHYGYKSVKHVDRIEIRREYQVDRPFGFGWLDHPRGRVAEEERGGFPARFLRLLYRPFIGWTAKRFARALAEYEKR